MLDLFSQEQNAALPPEQMLPALLWLGDKIPGGFCVYRADERQELIYVNPATMRLFGCETQAEFEALTGGTFPGMVHPDDLPAIQNSIDMQIADAANEKLDFVEYRIVRRDGTVRWVEDYGHLAQLPGAGEVYYVFLTDITDKRRTQQEKFRVELELEQARSANEIKSAFLFNLSHDIRTPMNAVMGFSALARRHQDEPERLRDCLDKVDTASRQLMALIDDMLEMSRLDFGRVELKSDSVSLREQLGLVLDLFRMQALEKRLHLVEDFALPEGNVLIDADRFRRIMGNLIGNAVKFTPEGGSVTVSARQKQVSESGFARFAFTVRDTGVGMSEEFMRRMYEAFEREESSTRSGMPGTGLGLSIVKRLLDMMGGSISVESRKGEGSVFTVELPLKRSGGAAAEPPRPPEAAPETPRADGTRRVLLVEDIEINRMLAETILEESGFSVESVPDGCDAVEAVKAHPLWHYDLILMDIQMPVMNGYEATRAIRALNRADARALPIIALSANAREEDRRQSLESGMNSHVAKPFDVARLISTINEYIEASEGRRTAAPAEGPERPDRGPGSA